MVMARWTVYPGLHIYHFGLYEPSALKRLIGELWHMRGQVPRLRILRADSHQLTFTWYTNQASMCLASIVLLD